MSERQTSGIPNELSAKVATLFKREFVDNMDARNLAKTCKDEERAWSFGLDAARLSYGEGSKQGILKGIVVALDVVALYGQDTLFEEIVKATGMRTALAEEIKKNGSAETISVFNDLGLGKI